MSRGASTSQNPGDQPSFNTRLPQRLFATGHFPNRRLNVYCKLDVLTFIHEVLRVTPEFQVIRDSCFGNLFDIPLNQCPLSCKLIHGLLTRQLVTKERYVLWTVYGGQPLRFSLEEFGMITGLPCREFDEGYRYDDQTTNGDRVDPYWEKLIGNDKDTTLADIGEMLKSEADMAGEQPLF